MKFCFRREREERAQENTMASFNAIFERGKVPEWSEYYIDYNK
jgi:hypothetical protein